MIFLFGPLYGGKHDFACRLLGCTPEELKSRVVDHVENHAAQARDLEALADTSDTVETRESSGSVTAVTSEEQTGDGQAADDKDAQSGDGQASDDQNVSNDDAQSDAGQTEGKKEESSLSQDMSDASDKQSGQASDSSGKNGGDGVYIVEQGDTLAIISRKMYGDVNHVDAICRMNGITDGNLIYVGQKLLLP